MLDHPEDEQRWRRRRGGLVPLLAKLAWSVVKVGWRVATRDAFHFGHMQAKGIVEPVTGRWMIDFGSFAQINDGQRLFGGRSGRSLATLSPFPNTGRSGDMLWMLRVLLGTVDASAEGEDTLHGTRCERLAVRIDLEKASAATSSGLRVPQVDSFEELRALPATVWIDGKHIRRVQLDKIEHRNLMLELWDCGIATDQFDWSRLPTFRSPGEAAHYSGQEESWYSKLRRRDSHRSSPGGI